MSLVLEDAADGVLTLSLNRPEALNAFTPPMLEALSAALMKADADPDVRACVLTGAGRAFSAGVDLKVLQGFEPRAGRIGDLFDDVAAAVSQAIRHARMPVIAKVHGACFTGALELALHCDFIFTTVDTKFGDTHAKWGVRPTWGMSQTLARAVGVRRARLLSFAAETFSGADAARWGLAVEAAADQAALDARVDEIARRIAAGSPGVIAAYKDLYRLHEELRPLDAALSEESARDYPDINDTAERLKGFKA